MPNLLFDIILIVMSSKLFSVEEYSDSEIKLTQLQYSVHLVQYNIQYNIQYIRR